MAQLDGELARAQEVGHFGGELGVTARGVVDDDLGDSARLPGPMSRPTSRMTRAGSTALRSSSQTLARVKRR